MVELVLHINREMLHHSAEIALLRDLYWWQSGPEQRSPGEAASAAGESSG